MPSKSDSKTQQRARELDSIMQAAQPVAFIDEPQVGLETVLADANAKWVFSKDGANGAMLVKTRAEATGGAAIKIENPNAAGQVNKTSQMMQAFFKGAEGVAPFAAPRVTLYSAEDLKNNAELAKTLEAKLKELGNDPTLPDKVRVTNQIESLKQVAAGEGVVLKMEFARGEQVTKIPLEERLAMYKTDAFAQNLGRAMPTFMAMGMNDHLAVDETNFFNNAANLMFDTGTGQLSAIDFSTQHQPNAQDPENPALFTYGQPASQGTQVGISKLDRYLQGALKDQASFEEAVDKLVENRGGGMRGMMDTFTNPVHEGGNFFATSEVKQLEKQLTLEDKRRFAANLILGGVQGMDYLKQNNEALRRAALSTHEEVNGVKLEHIHTEKDLASLCERIERVDTDKLNTQAALRQAEFRLPGIQAESAAIQQRSDRLAAKIDRLENNPKIMDRLRFLVRGKDNVINPVKAEKTELDARGADLKHQESGLLEAKAVAETQLKKHQEAAQQKVAVAPVKLRDNAQIADIAAHHPHHDHTPAAAHEAAHDEAPHKLREDKEMAEVVEHVEELHKPAVKVDESEKMDVKTPKVNIAAKTHVR